MSRHFVHYLGLALSGVTLAVLTACGGGETPSRQCTTQVNDTPQALANCVTAEGVRAHLVALADIAAAKGGDRIAGTPGYAAAIDYARRVFTDAGYLVTEQSFNVMNFNVLSPSVLEQRAPSPEATIGNTVFEFSGSGDVTASVGVPSVPTGCASADFAGFVPGRIALISRGDCSFTDKARNAQLAGATGVVIYDNVESEKLSGMLSTGTMFTLPVVGITRSEGQRLVDLVAQGLVLHLKADTRLETTPSSNLLAESTSGRDDTVIMVGAHLDTVKGTAGIDDNGSGVAGVLETARQMARVKPLNKLRFALWGSEETGSEGSDYYLTHLTPTEKTSVAAYLNFDMIAASNYGFFVLDSDGSDASDELPIPPGSTKIERTFAEYYAYRNIPIRSEPIDASSDHWPFFAAGIPVGGMNTGYIIPKTSEQAALWGGTAGQPFDGCYHKPCDNLGNVNDYALGINAGAIAWSALTLAMNPWTDTSSTSRSKTGVKRPSISRKDIDLKSLPIARFRGTY